MATCDDEGGSCEGQASFAVDDAQLVCALTALRDRTQGVVKWDEDVAGGYASRHGYIVVLPDGNVITRVAGREDYVPQVGPALLGAPPPASYFDDCLADTDPWTRFECLSFEAATSAKDCGL